MNDLIYSHGSYAPRAAATFPPHCGSSATPTPKTRASLARSGDAQILLGTKGPYRWVRHPIYAGVLLALLGTFVAVGQLRVFLLFAIVAIGMVIRTIVEDNLMAQQFPDEHAAYRRRTKMLLPLIF